MFSDTQAYLYLMQHSPTLARLNIDPEDIAALRAQLDVASTSEQVMIKAALAMCRWAEEEDFPLRDAGYLDRQNVRALMAAVAIVAQHEDVLLPGQRPPS